MKIIMASNENLEHKEFNSFDEDLIDLRNIVYLIIKNNKLIGLFLIFGIFIGSIVAISHKNIWQGNFQIVLDNKKSDPIGLESLSNNNPISSLVNFGEPNKLSTQVTILKSPSVLMDIFQFVKNTKNIKNYRFTNWRNKLNVSLESGTSVLNLSYKDEDKDLVLPVLEKISDKYKSYSTTKKEKELNSGIKYLNEQISIFEKKSSESLKRFQEFGEKHDLLIANNDTIKSTNTENQEIISNVEIERNKAKDKLRLINENLKFIQKINDKSNQIKPIAQSVLSMSDNSALQEYILNERELAKAKQTFRDEDKFIKNLKFKKNYYNLILKKEIINFYKAERNKMQAIINSSERPEGVFVKFKQLNQTVIKDYQTLDNLENQLRILSLSKARKANNWDLITEPTLIPFPVGQSRRGKMLISIISTVFVGLLIILLKEKKEDIIYRTQDIELISKNKNIFHVNSNDNEISNENLKILKLRILDKITDKLAFYFFGEISNEDFEFTNYLLKNNFESEKITISNKLSELINHNEFLIILPLEKNRKKELKDLLEKLSNYNINILGFLVIES